MILNRDYDYEELMRNTTEYTDPVPMKGSDPHCNNIFIFTGYYLIN